MDKYRLLLSRYFKPYLKQAVWSGILLLAGVMLRLLNPQILRISSTRRWGMPAAGCC